MKDEGNLTAGNVEAEESPEASQHQQSEESSRSPVNEEAELEPERPPEQSDLPEHLSRQHLSRPGAFAMHYVGAPETSDSLHDDLTVDDAAAQDTTGAPQQQQNDETPLFVLSALPVDEEAEVERDHRLQELERARLQERVRIQELETRLNQLGQQSTIAVAPLEVRLEATEAAGTFVEVPPEATEEAGASQPKERKRFKNAVLLRQSLSGQRKLTCVTLALIAVALVVAVSIQNLPRPRAFGHNLGMI